MAAKEYEFTVVHEDDHVIVVDKPAGMLAVPIPGSSVTNMLDLVNEYVDNNFETIVDTVHRIDRYTSGLMVFAKTTQAYDHLMEQFKNHEPKRTYLAIVRRIVEQDGGELLHHLKLVKEGFRNIVVDPVVEGATPARLTYIVNERFVDTTLVEVELDTGLKNQIRVQFEAVGHQLVGDQHYAPEEEEENLMHRQALHAWKLAIVHPGSQEQVEYAADLPADMLRLIDHYRWKKELLEGK